jgi:hypothetical protein
MTKIISGRKFEKFEIDRWTRMHFSESANNLGYWHRVKYTPHNNYRIT